MSKALLTDRLVTKLRVHIHDLIPDISTYIVLFVIARLVTSEVLRDFRDAGKKKKKMMMMMRGSSGLNALLVLEGKFSGKKLRPYGAL